MNPTLVILAAGAGTRYGGLKQLAPIGPRGQTLLEYSAFDALRAGFDRVVLVVGPRTEQMFRDRLDGGLARSVPVAYVHQRLEGLPPGFEPPRGRTKPWGTGQAVLAAESAVAGPFAVVNADDFYGAESYAALARFFDENREEECVAVVGFRVAQTLTDAGPVARALLDVDGEGRLRAIVEILEVWERDGRVLYNDGESRRQAFRGDELVSMNMWGFRPRILPDLRCRFAEFLTRAGRYADAEFLLPEAIQSLASGGGYRIEIVPGSGEWCGITFRQDEQRVRSIISSLVDQGRYPEELWESDKAWAGESEPCCSSRVSWRDAPRTSPLPSAHEE